MSPGRTRHIAVACWLLAGAPPGSGQEAVDPRIPGDYRTPDGELWVIARSASRPVWFEPATGEVRVLFEEDDSTFRAGPGLLVRDSVAFRVRFRRDGTGADGTGAPWSLTMERPGRPPVTASRVVPYRDTDIVFPGGEIQLEGTLFLPRGEGPHPGVVVVHGSGAQDRYGPFGYYRLVADFFARRGFAVLAFDKRGVGGSTGDWRTAGFDELAADVAAAARYLEELPEVRAGSVGLWGISQAGWVAAEATRRAPRPAFVILASAAGAGIDPAEQNLFNVRAELHAAGTSEESVGRALDAWRRLYALAGRARTRHAAVSPEGSDSLRHPGARAPLSRTAEARVLERVVAELRGEGLPEDLLPPPPSEVDWRAGDRWFLALDVGFDPLPVWRDYGGPLLAVFGGRDASTPTHRVVERLRTLGAEGAPGAVTVAVFPAADHFLLESESGTLEELPRLRRFVPGAFDLMADWALRQAGESEPTERGAVGPGSGGESGPAAPRSASRNASP